MKNLLIQISDSGIGLSTVLKFVMQPRLGDCPGPKPKEVPITPPRPYPPLLLPVAQWSVPRPGGPRRQPTPPAAQAQKRAVPSAGAEFAGAPLVGAHVEASLVGASCGRPCRQRRPRTKGCPRRSISARSGGSTPGPASAPPAWPVPAVAPVIRCTLPPGHS